MKKDYSISFVRLVSMFLIITCHVFQFYGNELAWWFNVGVQIFLFISGYLYSKKEVPDAKEFYKKQLTKILLPYYIYIFFVSFIYLSFDKQLFLISDFVKSLFLVGNLKGLEHLWFIRYIVICYLVTPLLHYMLKKCQKNNCKIFKLISLVVFNEFISLITKNFINGTWINCYILGIFFNNYYNITKDNNKRCLLILIPLTFNFIEILIKYILKLKIVGIELVAFNKFCNISHLLLGILLFYCLKEIYKYVSKYIKDSFLDTSDAFSYYIYITHHIFVLGKYSVFKYKFNIVILIIIYLILLVICSYFLKKITDIFSCFLKKDKLSNVSKKISVF